jgi:CRP/FNR family transcriptional regulator, cyclic AMP receptor protein
VAQVVATRRSARIFEEGTLADCCFVLAKGRAKVVINGRAGAEITLGIVESFDLVGEVALLDDSTRTASLVAVENCLLIRIPKTAFNRLREIYGFEYRLVAHAVGILRRATEQLRAIHTLNSPQRVAWCLGRLASQRGVRRGEAIVIAPRPSHQDLADMTGCTRETVSRVLTQLKLRRWIDWSGDAFTLNPKAFGPYIDP